MRTSNSVPASTRWATLSARVARFDQQRAGELAALPHVRRRSEEYRRALTSASTRSPRSRGWVATRSISRSRRSVRDGVARYKETRARPDPRDLNGCSSFIFHLETRKILGVMGTRTQATSSCTSPGRDGARRHARLFRGGVFNYPTLAECYKVAALDGLNKLRELAGV